MKKILIGLLALSSNSVFATEPLVIDIQQLLRHDGHNAGFKRLVNSADANEVALKT